MADTGAGGSGNAGSGGTSLRGMREQLLAAAQAIAEERRNQNSSTAVSGQPSNIKLSTKPVIDGSVLRSEERQRLAKERREQQEKRYAFKETQLLEKEKKAKLQYEKQMEERQRKIQEHKQKEQQRRAAAEEKRKQKLDEEKEHFEAMVNRTLERSNRLEHRQKRWSWGGSVTPDSDSRSGLSSASPPNPVDLVDKVPSSTELQTSEEDGSSGYKYVSSTVSPKQTDSIINKRLSSSSAALLNSDKTRRALISPLENSIISRLLTPTQASLARSKSTAVLSAAGNNPSAATSAISYPPQASKMPMRSRSIDRPKTSTTNAADSIQKSEVDKSAPTQAERRAPSPSLSSHKRSPSPGNVKRPPSPSTSSRLTQRSRPPSPATLKHQPSPPTCVLKPTFRPVQRPSITPAVMNIAKKNRPLETNSKPKDICEEDRKQEYQTSPASEKERIAFAGKTKEDLSSKIGLETTRAEEAAKIMAVKEQLAQELRDRQIWKRCQKEEERKAKEEIEKKANEDKKRIPDLFQLEETRSLEEEQQKGENKAHEEQDQRLIQLQQRLIQLQLLKEEAEARAQEEAERQKRERERIMEKNIQERLERKKRIEEIMKRTRKVEQNSEQTEKFKNEAINRNSANEADEGRLETVDPLAKVTEIGSHKDVKILGEFSDEMFLGVDHTIQLKAKTKAIKEPERLVTNGDDMVTEPRRYFHMTLKEDPSLSAKDVVTSNSEIVNADVVENTSNLNGKSNTWTYKDIFKHEVHAKSSKLNPSNTPSRNFTQNSSDAATFAPRHKLAFQADTVMNSLTTSMGSNPDLQTP